VSVVNKQIQIDELEIMPFAENTCFLCGCDEYISREHVIPRWILSRHGLWNRTITLLNGTSLPYRQLTIPCCENCNTKHLAILENKLKSVMDKGYDSVSAMDPYWLFQWASKIFYGLLFRELTLPADRKNPLSKSIITPRTLELYRTIYFFMLSIRVRFTFDIRPFSIFVVQIEHPGDFEAFDYLDSFVFTTMSIRINNVGVICVLQDNGAQEAEFAWLYEKIGSNPLTPVQFNELHLFHTYASKRFKRKPFYTITKTDGPNPIFNVSSLPLVGLSSEQLFEEMDAEEYREILRPCHERWGYYPPKDDILEGSFWSTILDNQGNFIKL